MKYICLLSLLRVERVPKMERGTTFLRAVASLVEHLGTWGIKFWVLVLCVHL